MQELIVLDALYLAAKCFYLSDSSQIAVTWFNTYGLWWSSDSWPHPSVYSVSIMQQGCV